jgi:hypothetical protein
MLAFLEPGPLCFLFLEVCLSPTLFPLPGPPVLQKPFLLFHGFDHEGGIVPPQVMQQWLWIAIEQQWPRWCVKSTPGMAVYFKEDAFLIFYIVDCWEQRSMNFFVISFQLRKTEYNDLKLQWCGGM